MTSAKLRLGVAYHGNRMLHHVREDMQDIVRHNCNLVVHMFSHNDWDRHKETMREIIAISEAAGLEVWIDNWGLGGPPGDKSHFLSYYPAAHQVYNDGRVDPVRVCLNNPDFRSFSKAWIDTVYEIGGRSIFWDEPHLTGELGPDQRLTSWTCCCPVCQKIFADRYGQLMPDQPTPAVEQFRIASLVDYFADVTAYSRQKGMYNAVCVMLGGTFGISLDTIDQLGDLPDLDNVGSDPYWYGQVDADPFDYVYQATKKNLAVCAKFGKEHNIWIQAYAVPRGREEEIIYATDAAYSAGARTILAWGFHGSDANDYRAHNPELAWQTTGAAFGRILDREREQRLAKYRARYKK